MGDPPHPRLQHGGLNARLGKLYFMSDAVRVVEGFRDERRLRSFGCGGRVDEAAEKNP